MTIYTYLAQTMKFESSGSEESTLPLVLTYKKFDECKKIILLSLIEGQEQNGRGTSKNSEFFWILNVSERKKTFWEKKKMLVTSI